MAQNTPARRTTSISTAGLTFGAVTAALTAGWAGVVVLTVVPVVTVVAWCWVLADGDRSRRLALLLIAWRRD